MILAAGQIFSRPPATRGEVVIRKDAIVVEEDLGTLRMRIFAHLLTTYFPEPRRVADLGAGPCIFSRIAQRLGHSVTAFDARTERKPDAEVLGSIEFVQCDIRDVDLEPFDLVVILGLFYHLTIDDQLKLLSRCAAVGPVVMDTQIHLPGRRRPVGEREEWEDTIVNQDTYEGVLYPENDTPQASFGNPVSFWHTPASLERLVEAAGFSRMTIVNPMFQTHLGARRFYVLR